MSETDPDLRQKLDTASLMPRGRWKALWEAAAAEFALPARERVERLIADRSAQGVAEAAAWLAKPEGAPPLLPFGAWVAAFGHWRNLDGEEGRKELRERARSWAKAVEGCADADRVLPLLLGGIAAHWRVSYPLGRANWLDAHPLGHAAAVTCLSLVTEGDSLRAHAFRMLSHVKGLAVKARGAMWLVTWSDPTRVEFDYLDYARLEEPAAIASILHDSFLMGWDRVPKRPGLTRALCRIIRREDPWLEPQWSEEDYDGKPMGPIVLQRALDILPRVAAATGGEQLARETLDPCWQSWGVDGAVARGRLGGVDAVPTLIAALSGDTVGRALHALGCIGAGARAALDTIRACPESRARTLALGAIDGSPQALEALLPLCEEVIAYAPEVRSQYEEGLITSDEYARTFDPAVEAVRLWSVAGFSPQQTKVNERLRAVCLEHTVVHGDFAIQRLLGNPHPDPLPKGEGEGEG